MEYEISKEFYCPVIEDYCYNCVVYKPSDVYGYTTGMWDKRYNPVTDQKIFWKLLRRMPKAGRLVSPYINSSSRQQVYQELGMGWTIAKPWFRGISVARDWTFFLYHSPAGHFNNCALYRVEGLFPVERERFSQGKVYVHAIRLLEEIPISWVISKAHYPLVYGSKEETKFWSQELGAGVGAGLAP